MIPAWLQDLPGGWLMRYVVDMICWTICGFILAKLGKSYAAYSSAVIGFALVITGLVDLATRKMSVDPVLQAAADAKLKAEQAEEAAKAREAIAATREEAAIAALPTAQRQATDRVVAEVRRVIPGASWQEPTGLLVDSAGIRYPDAFYANRD